MSRKSHEKLRKCMQIFLAHLFSHVGLCGLVVAYAAAGAFLFEFLEAEHELQKRRQIQRFREDCMQGLWNITVENMTTLDWENWIAMAAPLLKDFENQVVTATKMEGYDGKDADNQERQWSYSGALLYSVTVITTIGYGNLAPKTSAGKIITMIYALFGIPLMLLFLSNIGTLMAKTFQFAFARLCCSLSCCQEPPRSRRTHFEYYTAPVEHQQSNGGQLKPLVVAEDVQPVTKSERPAAKKHKDCDCVKPIPVDDKDLPQFDYEILFSDDPELPNRTANRYALPGGFYGFERLSPEAKTVLAECTEYLNDPAVPQNVTLEPRNHQIGAGSPVFPRNQGLNTLGDAAQSLECQEESEGCQTQELHKRLRVKSLKRKPTLDPDSVKMSTDEIPGTGNRRPTMSIQALENGYTPVLLKQAEKPRVPVTIVMAFVVGYVCVGAVVFSAWEEWSFLDGAYFSFITLSTIGFGDLVPGSNVLSTETHEGQTKFVICCLYLIVGLAIIAMSFNLVQEEVVTRFKKLGTNIGILDEK